MLRASISETKSRLSALLHKVRDGESVLITDRGRPVAQLVPVEVDMASAEDWLSALGHDGAVRPRIATLPPGFLQEQLPEPRVSAVETLMRDREEGR
jgi:prevent-host-death family protein